MAFTDITDPSNWEEIMDGGWDGTKYDFGHYPTFRVSFIPVGSVAIPGNIVRFTIDVVDIDHVFGDYIYIDVEGDTCPGDVCKTYPLLQTGVILEAICSPELANVDFYTASCRIYVTKIEIGDATEEFFWTNLQDLTEVI